MEKSFYIGERSNPQLSKPYYRVFGQLTKKEAKKKEDTIYGSMRLIEFKSKEEYDEKIKSLEKEGFNVYQ